MECMTSRSVTSTTFFSSSPDLASFTLEGNIKSYHVHRGKAIPSCIMIKEKTVSHLLLRCNKPVKDTREKTHILTDAISDIFKTSRTIEIGCTLIWALVCSSTSITTRTC